jgi:ATP-binding cassette subfamily F protein 3
LRPADTPLEHMIALVKALTLAGKIAGQATREQDLRSFLGTFNFSGDMVKQAVGSMSGGEKARLVLCMIVWQRPNLLLLDEPTNHLDLATREALAMALNEFEGTVMLVSHDRALLRSVCDEFWMVSRGGVEPFDGDLDDYQRYLLDEAKRQRELIKEAQSAAAKQEAKATKSQTLEAPGAKAIPQSDASKKLKKELLTVESRIEQLNTEGVALEGQLSTNTHPTEIADLGKRLKMVSDELKQLEDRWLRITEDLEA